MWECRNQVFFILEISQVLNKILKNPKHPFVEIGRKETCAKFQQKLLKSMTVGAHQSFQSFRQNTWFLCVILYYLIKKSQSIKPNFILTMQSTLRKKILIKFILYMQIILNVSYKLIQTFWMCLAWQDFARVLKF